MEHVCFSLVRRSANSVVHSIARVSGSLESPCMWALIALDFLLPCLMIDLY